MELHIACPVTAGPWRSRTYEYQGATLHLIRLPPGRLQSGFLFDPLFFLGLYRRLRPDVVHGWGTEDSFSTTAKFLAPKRHVVQVQGLINAYLPHFPASKSLRYVAFREKGNLRTAKHVFVESGFSKQITLPYCGSNTQTFVVDHPLRPDFLTAKTGGSSPKEVLFLGSITERKGFLDAIRAFAQGAPPDWRLTMIGPGAKADFDILSSEVKTLGLEGRFKHLTKVDTPEVIEHMRNASIYLLPTLMDTGPTALKEALAMGLWPVCYDNSAPENISAVSAMAAWRKIVTHWISRESSKETSVRHPGTIRKGETRWSKRFATNLEKIAYGINCSNTMEPLLKNTPLERTWRNKLYTLWDVALILLDEKISTCRSHFSLWLQQCPHGARLITAGHCNFKAKRAGSIRLGTKVRFQAYWRSNRVGLNNQVILHTLDHGIIEIGDNSGGSSIVISAMNRVTIGDNVRMGGNVRIFDHDFHSLDMTERTTLPLNLQNIRNAPIVIEDGVFIGTGAMILKGAVIGRNSIIGAGAVVSGPIPANEIWVGNPARFAKKITSHNQNTPTL